MKLRRVLVPTDLSLHSDQAVIWGASFTELRDGLQVDVRVAVGKPAKVL